MSRLSLSIAYIQAFIFLPYSQYSSKLRKIWGWFVWGLFGILFGRGFFQDRRGRLLLVLWLVDLVWFFFTKRKQGDNSEFIHPTLRLGEYQDKAWCFRKLNMNTEGYSPLLEIKPNISGLAVLHKMPKSKAVIL